jgi:uncharacterized ParB-like nuclease family protein
VAQILEFHQLDRRLEHLRVRHPTRFRRLLASLAETGQQTPIIVIPCEQRYLVIDGHQRIAALKQLRRDTVNALVWEIPEAEALLLARSLRMNSEPETALEQGWLLSEMEEKLGYTIEELARRFDRSASSSIGGNTAGSGAAASSRRTHRRANRHEVPGSGGASQRGTVRPDGTCICTPPLDHAASRAALHRLARRHNQANARADSCRAGAVSENAGAITAANKSNNARKRSESDRRHRAARA